MGLQGKGTEAHIAQSKQVGGKVGKVVRRLYKPNPLIISLITLIFTLEASALS